jgi:hypothetical protein
LCVMAVAHMLGPHPANARRLLAQIGQRSMSIGDANRAENPITPSCVKVMRLRFRIVPAMNDRALGISLALPPAAEHHATRRHLMAS